MAEDLGDRAVCGDDQTHTFVKPVAKDGMFQIGLELRARAARLLRQARAGLGVAIIVSPAL